MTRIEAMITHDHVYPIANFRLPERCRVLITILPDEPCDPLFDIDALAVETGIPDLAEHLDHYLYGGKLWNPANYAH